MTQLFWDASRKASLPMVSNLLLAMSLGKPCHHSRYPNYRIEQQVEHYASASNCQPLTLRTLVGTAAISSCWKLLVAL